MKNILLFYFIFLYVGQVWAQIFLPKTEDIPQMSGLTEIEEVANFDNPDERLLILNATSLKSITDIQNFYETNLKNLGWIKTKNNTFQRGKDTFRIEMKHIKNKTKIQFILTQE